MQLLLGKGMNTNARCRTGTPAEIAEGASHLHLAELLLPSSYNYTKHYEYDNTTTATTKQHHSVQQGKEKEKERGKGKTKENGQADVNMIKRKQ